jgi:tetratricopeptide (TPR) repeat protein
LIRSALSDISLLVTALAPRPQADPRETAEGDLGEELDGLRRRADEQAALLRKHQAAVTQLADSVAALVALGKKRNRWINLNSFVAYVLFTVLLGGAMLFVYRSRVGELEARRAEAIAERDLARATPVAAAHDDAVAASLYALVQAGDDAGLVARAAEIATAALTPTERAMLTDAARAAKARLARGGTGGAAAPSPADDVRAAFKTGAWRDTAAAADRAIALDPDGAGAAQLRYYKGVASWKLGEHRAAADELERALACDGAAGASGGGAAPPCGGGGTLDGSSHDARYLLAASLEKLGEVERARVEYDRFATQYPKNPYAVYARRRSSILARKARPAPARKKEPAAVEAPAPAEDKLADPFPTEAATPPAPAPAPDTTSSPPPP